MIVLLLPALVASLPPGHAYAKIRKGSSLVMFITSLMYRGPQNITVLKRGLASLLRRDGFNSIGRSCGCGRGLKHMYSNAECSFLFEEGSILVYGET